MKRNRMFELRIKVDSRSERADDNIFYNKVITWQLSSSSLEICSLCKSYCGYCCLESNENRKNNILQQKVWCLYVW